MSQTDTLLTHLKRKSITTFEAFEKYGMTRLSGRVFDLRNRGYSILAKPESKNGKRYFRYQLAA